MKQLIFSFIFLVQSFQIFSITRNVPADYPTIQAALNAGNSGDTILVQAGTYYEHIIWPNINGLVLTGTSKENVIINGSNSGTVIIISPFNTTIDSTTIIKDITITNGSAASEGGGVSINNSSPTMLNLFIYKNKANNGCGLFLSNSLSKVINCIISENMKGAQSGSSGGGIYITGGSPKLIGCTVNKNRSYDGAGIYVFSGDLSIDSSVISENLGVSGSGIFTMATLCIISNSQINNNAGNSDFSGGGIVVKGYYSNLTVNNCILKNNDFAEIYIISGSCIIDNSTLESNPTISACGILTDTGQKVFINNSRILNHKFNYEAAAINSWAQELEIRNSVIAYNSIENAISDKFNKSGGIYCGRGNVILNKVAFIGNSGAMGGALATIYAVPLTIQNCTFYNNSGPISDALYLKNPLQCNASNNNFFNNGYAFYNDDISSYANAANNYWGHNSGPYNQNMNPSGLGDSTNYFVNVSPWLTAPDTAAPLIFPLNIEIFDETANSITLKWDNFKVADLAGYKIYYDTDSSAYSFKNVVNAGRDTVFILNGLEPGMKYFVSVKSYDNSENESWFSLPLSAVTSELPIPVELTSFTASVIDKRVILNWVTATELQNQGWNIERKPDNATLWEKIGFVAGAGSITETAYYKFTDENIVSGKTQYRLKQIDYNGTFKYSQVISVGIDNMPAKFALYQNYPNPFNPETTIKFALPHPAFVEINVYNIIGEKVYTLISDYREAGYYSVNFNASSATGGLANGTYIYKIIAGEYIDSKKFVLLK